MINIDALNDEEKLAALESIHKSIAESKEIQRKKITTNVEMIVKALKKIEADLKQRYDETGQLIANLKSGEDGRDGKDGKDGKNGKDGRDGPMGPRGYDGVPGRNGLDGTDGVSITDAHIDFDGSLIIHLSSGRVINVGEVVAADIAEKIKVITNGGGTSQGVLDAIASLQAQIDAIASGLEYQGTWNASANTPTLVSSVGTAGYYYIVATAGSTNLNGITDWQIGDWAVFNGTIWQKIDQSNLVTSVAGRTGAIVLTTADIGGLGTIATQNANNVSITGGSITGITDLAIADGGTGASTANAAFNALAPSQASNSGKYLTTNGTDTSWATLSGVGTVTSVSGTGTVNGLTLTGTVTSSGSLTLGGTLSGIANSALTNSSITINGSATSLGGSINVGTVTSVAATVPSFLSIAGSPVTSSGTLAITLSGTALPTTSGGTGLTSFTTNGVVYASSTSALATGSSLTFDGSKLVNTGYNKSSYQVSTGGIGTFESSGGAYLSYASGANIYSMLNGSGTEDILNLRASAHLFYINSAEQARLTSTGLGLGTNSPGSKLDVKGTLRLSGSTSGYVGLAPAAAAGSTTYTLPSADGTANQALVTNGSGTLSWASTATGTVTSVGGTGTVSGISLSGTVTSSGNLTLGGTLDLSAYNGAGAFTTLSASSTVTLSGGTANGVAYLNGSKVVTSGSALTFDGTNLGIGASSPLKPLDITFAGTSGARRFLVSYDDSVITIKGANASNDPEAIRITGDNIRFNTGTSGSGSEVGRFTSTGLGIGTSSPAYKLDVVGSATNVAKFQNGSNQSVFIASASNLSGILSEANNQNGWLMNSASNYVVAYTNGGEKLRLDTSGNLGLGVTPSASTIVQFEGGANLLMVGRGNAYLSNNATFNSGFKYINTSTAGQYNISGSTHSWSTAASGTAGNAITFTQAMTLDASGNLSIGATASNGKLTIKNPNVSGEQQILKIQNAASTGDLGGFTFNQTDDMFKMSVISNSGYLSFGTGASATERVRIDSSGNMGVGTTSPSQRLDVTVSSSTEGSGLAVTNSLTGGYGSGLTFYSLRSDTSAKVVAGSIVINGASAWNSNATTSSSMIFSTVGANTLAERARIDSSGNLLLGATSAGYTSARFVISLDNSNKWLVGPAAGYADRFYVTAASAQGVYLSSTSATSWSSASDERVKTDLKPIQNAVTKISSLRAVTGRYKTDEETISRSFLIAQDVLAVLPEAVDTTNPDLYGLAYTDIIPLLVAAIKEQQVIIESLTQRIATLEAK